MAEVALAFYKTPIQAESLGLTITKTVTLTAEEIRKIRDFYQAIATQEEFFITAFITYSTYALTRNAKAAFNLGGTTVSFISTTIFRSYYDQLATKFDMIITSNFTKFTATYKYKRKGSNDGAYWLTNITIK